MGDTAVYAGLFLTALVAGTILPFLPGSSELALSGLLATGEGGPLRLVALATVGTTIGAALNYLIGRNVAGLAGRAWFPIPPQTLARVGAWFKRYGIWLMLLCWIPTLGDVMTVVAGLLRADFRVFLLLVLIGRLFGYSAIAGGITWIMH